MLRAMKDSVTVPNLTVFAFPFDGWDDLGQGATLLTMPKKGRLFANGDCPRNSIKRRLIMLEGS